MRHSRLIYLQTWSCLSSKASKIPAYIPEAKHVTSHTGVYVTEVIVTNCSPDTANFEFQTTFARRLTSSESYVYISKFITLVFHFVSSISYTCILRLSQFCVNFVAFFATNLIGLREYTTQHSILIPGIKEDLQCRIFIHNRFSSQVAVIVSIIIWIR